MKNIIIFLLLLPSLQAVNNNSITINDLNSNYSKVKTSVKEPHEILVDKIIAAIKKQDTELFAATCIPDQKSFDRILKAEYKSNPSILSSIKTVQARDTLIEKLKISFNNLIETGSKEGIKWNEIELSWVGIGSTLIGDVYQMQLSFHVAFNRKEYRIGIDYCTQLEKDPKIILLGEFKWEGIYNK